MTKCPSNYTPKFFGFSLSEPDIGKCGSYAKLPSELWEVVERVSKINFPIECKRDLVSKLGDKTDIKLGNRGDSIDASTMAMFIPAQYFPMSTLDNFAEKLSEFYFQRREPIEKLRPKSAEEFKAKLDEIFDKNPEVIEAAAQLVSKLTEVGR